ncbi:MAG: hypothetical protein LC130_30455 [Bryobacterales bacterium]|nr:hypothetical protein [Bryobacterales bacterium]
MTAVVIGVGCATCPTELTHAIVALYLVEWAVISLAYWWFCRQVGPRGIALTALPFVVSCVVSMVVVDGYQDVYQAAWGWSDDYWYLEGAEYVADCLVETQGDIMTGWQDYLAYRYGDWTLAGWPFFLGTAAAFVVDDYGMEEYHAVALSLNATFLALTQVLVFHALRDRARRLPWLAAAAFLFLAGNPLLFAGESRKESMLQFVLMASFVATAMEFRRRPVTYAVLLAIGLVGLATTRLFYLVVPLCILCEKLARRMRLSLFQSLLLSLLCVVVVYCAARGVEIRTGATVDDWMGETLDAEAGLGMRIYNLPVVGPSLYYLIAPLPAASWGFLRDPLWLVQIIQSVGSVCYFLAACYVVCQGIRRPALWREPLFRAASIAFLLTFAGAVAASSEPRYKCPSNFFLATMLFLSWVEATTGMVVVAGAREEGSAADIYRGRLAVDGELSGRLACK